MKLSLAKYAKYREISVDNIEGNVLLGVKVKGLRINKIKKIPQDVVIKIQQAQVNFSGFNPKNADFKINNARVEIARSQPIIFGGTCKKGRLDLNIYARAIDIKSCLWLFSDSVILKNATSGQIIEPDFYLKGTISEKDLYGKMVFKKVSFEKYSLSDSLVFLKVRIYSKGAQPNVKGDIILESGVINLGGSAIKNVHGKIIYTGDPYNPAFNLEGDSAVGGTRIHVAYKGTYLKPEFRLTSEPALAEDDLMMMLFTGNIFKAESKSLGAELKVTDNVSLEGQTQLKEQESQMMNIDQKDNDKILLKYKNKF